MVCPLSIKLLYLLLVAVRTASFAASLHDISHNFKSHAVVFCFFIFYYWPQKQANTYSTVCTSMNDEG